MIRFLFAVVLLSSVITAAQLRTDVEYGEAGGVSLTLDASVPDGAGPFPTAIVVHGGGFTQGRKQGFEKPILRPLTDAGFTWFTIDYRLAPQYPFPAAVEDVLSALHWVREHAAEYKVDTKRVALIGESAGAFLVDYAALTAPEKESVAAVVSFYGPHNLLLQVKENGGRIGQNLRDFAGLTEMNAESEKKLHDMSPSFLVRKGTPPFLLIHGTADQLVPYQQSVDFCRAIREKGGSCELFTVEDAKHGVGAWESNSGEQAYKRKMIDWLRAVLQ